MGHSDDDTAFIPKAIRCYDCKETWWIVDRDEQEMDMETDLTEEENRENNAQDGERR